MILFVDGFDHYATADMSAKWTVPGHFTINPSGGRNGGGCASYSGNYYLMEKSVTPNANQVFTGFACKISTPISDYGDPANPFLTFRNDAVAHLTVCVAPNGNLSLYRGEDSYGTLLASAGTIAVNTWVYVEAMAKIGPSGQFELRINGTTLLTYSGNTAKDALVHVPNRVAFGTISDTATAFDDLYITDEIGSNAGFLGDITIQAIYPDANGPTIQCTATPSGTANFDCVNDGLPNATDYVTASETVGAGLTDIYSFTPASTLGKTVLAVQTSALVVNAGTEPQLALVASTGAVNAVSSAKKTTEAVPFYLSHVFDAAPAGGPWNQLEINSDYFGVKRTA